MHVLPESWIRPREKHRPEIRSLVGTAIDGRYLITELAGRGGFGSVYVALELPGLEPVAVKAMTADENAAVLGKQLVLFAKEIDALARLSHPNIVGFRGSGDYEGVPYFAMEYIVGSRSLASEVKTRAAEERDFAPEEVCRVVTQTAAALTYAHGHALKIIHRDLKPDNLMLVEDPKGGGFQVKVLDFGLAKYTAERTRTAHVAGTARYMAPEQFRAKGLGPATDLYALGCIAIELITRRPAFPSDLTEAQRLKADPNHDPVAGYHDLELDPQIEAFFRKALAFDSKDRFASAAEFAIAFEQMIDAVSAEVERSFACDLADLLDTTDRAAVQAALAQKERELADREARLDARERDLHAQKATVESERRSLRATAEFARQAGQGAGRPETDETAEAPDDGPGATALVAARQLPPKAGAEWLNKRKLGMLGGMLALIALVAGVYALTKSPAGSVRREQLLAGVVDPARPLAVPEPSSDSDDLDLGRAISGCFHPMSDFTGVAMGEPENADGLIAFLGRIEFRGALSELPYEMEFRTLMRKVDGKLEMQVTPTADTAPFPPSANCRLRSWTEVGE